MRSIYNVLIEKYGLVQKTRFYFGTYFRNLTLEIAPFNMHDVRYNLVIWTRRDSAQRKANCLFGGKSRTLSRILSKNILSAVPSEVLASSRDQIETISH